MIFDDSRETVLSNLEQYIRGGCYPFCVKPAYFGSWKIFGNQTGGNWSGAWLKKG